MLSYRDESCVPVTRRFFSAYFIPLMLETDDQLRSIRNQEISRFSTNGSALVGDVGFGKTEVMRAAFGQSMIANRLSF